MNPELLTLTLEIFPQPDGGYKANIQAPVLTKYKDGVWIVHSPAFGTIGYSTESEEAALDDHDADVEAFLGLNLKQGTLNSALSRLGWQPRISGGRSVFEAAPDIPVQLLKHARVKNSNYEVCYA